MSVKIETQRGIADYYIELSIDDSDFLSKVDKLVDWKPFEIYLAKHLKRGPAAVGQLPYPDLRAKRAYAYAENACSRSRVEHFKVEML